MDRPTYTSKIDSYSYGVMIIHVLCGRWPFPAGAFRPDPQNPEVMLPVLELDRRAQHLRDISQDHPLMGLIRQCLSNAPRCRPEASAILHQITTIASRVPETHQNKIEMLQHWEGRVQSQQTEIQTLRSQIEFLTAQTQEVEALRAEVKRLSVRSPQREGKSGQSSQSPRQPAPRPRPRSRQQSLPHPPMDSQVNTFILWLGLDPFNTINPGNRSPFLCIELLKIGLVVPVIRVVAFRLIIS